MEMQSPFFPQKGSKTFATWFAQNPVFRITLANLMPRIRKRLHLISSVLLAYGGQGRRGYLTRSPSGIQVKLPNFVKQRLITDAEHLRRVFTAPVCFLEGVGDGFHLRLIFQASHQCLKALFPDGRRLL